MKSFYSSERLFIEEIMQAAGRLKKAIKGLPMGSLIKSIRVQLGMSQQALAKRAGVPQSTVSRVEQGQKDTSLFTLHKVLGALSCQLVVAPLLEGSIDEIRRRQAKKVAQKRIEYLKGTMNLEGQEPDSRFVEELLKREEEELLKGPGIKLWEE